MAEPSPGPERYVEGIPALHQQQPHLLAWHCLAFQWYRTYALPQGLPFAPDLLIQGKIPGIESLELSQSCLTNVGLGLPSSEYQNFSWSSRERVDLLPVTKLQNVPAALQVSKTSIARSRRGPQ